MDHLTVNTQLATFHGATIHSIDNDILYGNFKRPGVINTVGALDYFKDNNLLLDLYEHIFGSEELHKLKLVLIESLLAITKEQP